MGKRKHIDEDEEEGGAHAQSSSTSQQSSFHQPTQKRLKQEWQSDGSFGVQHQQEHGSLAPLLNGHPSSSTSGLNGSLSLPIEDDNAIWLVRKPLNVPLEELNKIVFRRKGAYKRQRFSISTPTEIDGRQIECQLGTVASGRKAILVSSDHKKKFDEKSVFKSESYVHGTVWINDAELTDDNVERIDKEKKDEATGSDYEEILKTEINIPSIRRKPVLDESNLKERLKAFGTNNKPEISREEPKTHRKKRK